jgi:hypothetical protein
MGDMLNNKWFKAVLALLGVAATIAPLFVKSKEATAALNKAEEAAGAGISVLAAESKSPSTSST